MHAEPAMPPIHIPVFVVSLPDCAERRETISKTLSNLGVEFEFVDAVDGRQGLDSQYEDQIDRAGVRRAGLILSDAEFACALSHLNIYRRIVSGNIAYALVLEDDAIPYPKLVDFLDGDHYRDAELTQLYSSGLRPYVRWGETKELWGGGTYTSYILRLKMIGAVAYTVSYRAALHFVKHAVPVNTTADWPTCINALIAKQQVRVVCPSLVGHPKSDLHTSLLDQFSSKEATRKTYGKKRYFLGVYIPPLRKIRESLVSGRFFYKLLAKRLP